MPGHKGVSRLGIEEFDLTEVSGADSLFEADGIIFESEKNAGQLFGAKTFFSAGGSSLSIRAMLYLAKVNSGKSRLIAGRNAHKSLVQSAALLGIDVDFIWGEGDGFVSRRINAKDVEKAIHESDDVMAVYITAPDYLGVSSDLSAIAEVCHLYGLPLLVDNAHGAYLKFLTPSRHPIDLGADMCADSAHKTLPALTGASYLHIAHSDKYGFSSGAREALSLFGSTSPSYLILASLDLTNKYINDGYRHRLSAFVEKLNIFRLRLEDLGYNLVDTSTTDPLKITFRAWEYGITGTDLGNFLRRGGIECEFSDRDYLVLMLTPDNSEDELELLYKLLSTLPKGTALKRVSFADFVPARATSIRDAVMSSYERISICETVGRVLASPSVPCPPAVPILVPGELVDERAVSVYEYYGIKELFVKK